MRIPHTILLGVFTIAAYGLSIASAAPNVTNVSLRGLQIGGTTTLVLEGSDLLPQPSIIAGFPIAAQQAKPNAQPNRVEIEITLPEQVLPGIYQLRIASAKGISNPIAVGLDRLVQQPFTADISRLPVALHGAVSGTQVLVSRFQGTKGAKFVAEVEGQRLGANFKPVLRLKDASGRQIAWSSSLPRIGGDARMVAELPADGGYSVELHDLLYRAGTPGFFRLKLGELAFADLSFPLGVQAGTKTRLQLVNSNLPADTAVEMEVGDAPNLPAAMAIPVNNPLFSGSSPGVAITRHAELVENQPAGARQELPSFPIAVSGRISQKGEEDQFVLPVTPGARLRMEVYAQRAGSPLDGVLAIRSEQGAQLAASDDRPGSADPGLDFLVPAGVTKLTLALRDLAGRGGADFLYRLEVLDLGQPRFSVQAEADRINIPAGTTQVLRCQLNRQGYPGGIQLAIEGLPAGIQLSGHEIPADATNGLITFTAPPGPPTAWLGQMIARGGATTVAQIVATPETDASKHRPWLRGEFALAVTEPGPLAIHWANSADDPMLQGTRLPLNLTLQRADSVMGKVRLRLLTSQVMPRKKIKENNQDKEVDDLDRALRLDGDPVIAPEIRQTTVQLLVPADLPTQDWQLVLAADLLGADDKSVVASATTTVLVKRPTVPLTLELASAAGLEARAGLGETGKLVGKIRRHAAFQQPVTVTVLGLPKEYPAPTVTVPADQENFELPVRFPYGSKPAELKDTRLVATYQPNPQNAEVLVRSQEIPLGALKVVPGEAPPAEKPKPEQPKPAK